MAADTSGDEQDDITKEVEVQQMADGYPVSMNAPVSLEGAQ